MINETIPSALLALSTAETVKEVGEIALVAAKRFAGADGATLVLREGDLCYYADERAISPLWQGLRFPVSACISGWVMQTCQQVMIPDIYADARVPHDAYKPTFVKSLCMTPVGRGEGKTAIAALGAYWQQYHMITEDQSFLLGVLADAVGQALRRIEEHGRTLVPIKDTSEMILKDCVVYFVNAQSGKDAAMIAALEKRGARVVECLAAQPALPEVFSGLPSIAVWNHGKESGECVYREVVRKLNDHLEMSVPFLHVSDGSCNFSPERNQRKCVLLNMRIPNFDNTFPHVVAGVVSATKI